jgi:hypothetical protein
MFLLGVIVGAVGATAFILYGDGELLIRLGEQMKKVAARYRRWTEQRTPDGPPSAPL